MLRPAVLRALAEYTRTAVAAANGDPLDLGTVSHNAIIAAKRDPGQCTTAFRESAVDVVEACIYALGGEVQS